MKVKCSFCKKYFEKGLKHVNFYRKNGWKFYCSNTCSNDSKKTGKFYTCNTCGVEIYRTKSTLKKSKKVYCSSSCACKSNNKIYRSGENNPNYINGFASYRKRALRHYKNKCNFCDYSDIRVLEVHHIDRDKTNNHLSNLVLVCPTHHTEIHRKIIVL